MKQYEQRREIDFRTRIQNYRQPKLSFKLMNLH